MKPTGTPAWVRDRDSIAFHARWYMSDAQKDIGDGDYESAQALALLAIASWLDLLATGGDQ